MRALRAANVRLLPKISRRPSPCIYRSEPRPLALINKALSGKNNDPEPGEGVWKRALRSATRTWSKLDTPQRLYTVAAAAAVLVAVPQVLILTVITIERLFVGGLLFLENLLLLAVPLAVLLAAVALVAVGVYLFLVKGRQRS